MSGRFVLGRLDPNSIVSASERLTALQIRC